MIILVNRIKTGIEGLDNLLYGGIPETDQVILSGGPGTGKTLTAFEYAYRSAKSGYNSVFFALEEEAEKVLANAKEAFSSFTDIDDLVKNKKLRMEGEELVSVLHSGSIGSTQYEFGKIVSDIESVVLSSGAKRIVIDSLSALELLISDPVSYRRSMLALAANLRRMGVTTILTAEIRTPERKELRFKPEYFIFDGIIMMYERGEDLKRVLAMEVIKMRGSNHSFVTTPYEITSKGIHVVAEEELSSE